MDRYVVAFVLFAFLGWVWESIYCTVCDRKWANRGFLYGPICPIYGFGGLFGLALFDLVNAGHLPDLKWWAIFIAGFAVSMVLEYPTSWALEKLFHARWWDYSRVPLNINGRTSVPTSVGFGVGAILVMEVVIPWADRGLGAVPDTVMNLLALVLVSIISVDTTLTISALTDFQKRVASIDEAFQNHMTDIVNRIYGQQNGFYRQVIRRIAVFKLPERKNRIAGQLREEQFVELLKDFYNSDAAKQVDVHPNQGDATPLEHGENVAWISWLINEKLHLNADEKELIEAAMLHDLHLHGRQAENSDRDREEQEAIRRHMWPLNMANIPKSKEAMIIYFADKYCALIETIRRNKRFRRRR